MRVDIVFMFSVLIGVGGVYYQYRYKSIFFYGRIVFQ